MAFPASMTAYSATAGGDTPNTTAGIGLSGLLNAFEVDITALGTKVGTGSSTPVANTLFYGTGTGTSAWQGLTSAQLASIVSDETGSGSLVFGNSPTIVTPTVASLTNMQHNHTNAAGGGQLSNTSFATGTLGTDKLTNPYKFSVYRNAAQNSGAGSFAVMNFDTKTYDTGSNVDIVTNKGRFTAPIAGFYCFTAMAGMSVAITLFVISLYKNGSEIRRGTKVNGVNMSNGANSVVSGILQLSANDYVEVYTQANGAGALDVGSSALNSFDGFLVSAT